MAAAVPSKRGFEVGALEGGTLIRRGKGPDAPTSRA